MRVAVVAPMSVLSGLRTISELNLRRAWPRGRDHLLLEYATADGRLVAGQWFADPARAATVAERTAEGPGGPVRVRGRLVLQAGGADRRLPGLAGLLARPGATLV